MAAMVLAAALGPWSVSAKMVPTPLESQLGKARPLLIFVPEDREDARLLQQLKLLPRQLDSSPEFRDLDLFTYILPFKMPTDGRLSSEQASHARKRFHIAPVDFTVILLGKDGGEKLRSHTPVTMETLTQLIDSMPMRQQEVRDRHPR